jgi:hypothetical protein
VVDWVDMGIGGARWYTFNVADASISTAIVLLLVLGLFGERSGRHSGPHGGQDVAPASDAAGSPVAGTEQPR